MLSVFEIEICEKMVNKCVHVCVAFTYVLDQYAVSEEVKMKK